MMKPSKSWIPWILRIPGSRDHHENTDSNRMICSNPSSPRSWFHHDSRGLWTPFLSGYDTLCI